MDELTRPGRDDQRSVHIDSLVVDGWPAGEAVGEAIRAAAGDALAPAALAEVSRAVAAALAELGGVDERG